MPSSPFAAASLRIEDGIAEFVHERPRSRNPLSGELRQDYVRMLDIIEADVSVRVVILRGSGGSFSAGGDLREMEARIDSPSAVAVPGTRRRIEATNAWLQRLLNLDAIVIAAVDGPAYGGGFSLLLHADLVLASPRARFCMAFARVGLIPDFGSHCLLTRIVGLGVARDLMLTARSIGAARARRLGIVHAIHPVDELVQRTHELAARLCEGPPEALAMTKKLLNRSQHTEYGTLGTLEAESQAIAMTTTYHREAVGRFRSATPPLYDWDRDAKALGFVDDE